MGSQSSSAQRAANGDSGVGEPSAYLDDEILKGVTFLEVAVFSCPLPTQHWIEFGRWNPVGLLVLAPLWSYHVCGAAEHWWFVARSADHQYYYAAEFCADQGNNVIIAQAFRGLSAAVNMGLQYPSAKWWLAREWKTCFAPHSKLDLDGLALASPCASAPYSWLDNNCQHFALTLYDGVAARAEAS